MTKITSLVLSALLICSPFWVRGDDAPSSKSIIYKKTEQGELSLTAYFPPDWKADQKRPVIVFFFGGGWTNGKLTQFEPQSKHLAQRGMVAICADYRVKSRHQVTPEACVEDAKSAIRWVRQNRERLGIDPNKVVGAGGSAGGHLAACTALCDGLDSKQEDLTISSKPNVLVLFNPVLNFNLPKLLERISDNSDVAEAISPTRHLAKDSPPTLLFFGTKDQLLKQGEEFLERSKKIGHHAEIYLAEGVGHSFFNKSPWLEKTIDRMDDFLVSQGYLKVSSASPQTAP